MCVRVTAPSHAWLIPIVLFRRQLSRSEKTEQLFHRFPRHGSDSSVIRSLSFRLLLCLSTFVSYMLPNIVVHRDAADTSALAHLAGRTCGHTRQLVELNLDFKELRDPRYLTNGGMCSIYTAEWRGRRVVVKVRLYPCSKGASLNS